MHGLGLGRRHARSLLQALEAKAQRSDLPVLLDPDALHRLHSAPKEAVDARHPIPNEGIGDGLANPRTQTLEKRLAPGVRTDGHGMESLMQRPGIHRRARSIQRALPLAHPLLVLESKVVHPVQLQLQHKRPLPSDCQLHCIRHAATPLGVNLIINIRIRLPAQAPIHLHQPLVLFADRFELAGQRKQLADQLAPRGLGHRPLPKKGLNLLIVAQTQLLERAHHKPAFKTRPDPHLRLEGRTDERLHAVVTRFGLLVQRAITLLGNRYRGETPLTRHKRGELRYGIQLLRRQATQLGIRCSAVTHANDDVFFFGLNLEKIIFLNRTIHPRHPK